MVNIAAVNNIFKNVSSTYWPKLQIFFFHCNFWNNISTVIYLFLLELDFIEQTAKVGLIAENDHG